MHIPMERLDGQPDPVGEPDMAQIATTPLLELPYEDAVQTTLLELVQTVGELTEDDREVVETVVRLLRTGRVRLVGNFRGQRLAEA